MHKQNKNFSANLPLGKWIRPSGFSLVELLVVLTIVALLSSASVLGFNALGRLLRTREAAAFLADLVRQEELAVLRGDFRKSTILFLRDYALVQEWPEGSLPLLSLDGPCGGALEDDQIAFSEMGILTQKNDAGEVLSVKNVAAETRQCVPFSTAHETEWSFQLRNGTHVSPLFRFVHFNLKRDGSTPSLWVKSNAGSRIEISAPYGKKRFFDKDGNTQNGLSLLLGDAESQDTLNLP